MQHSSTGRRGHCVLSNNQSPLTFFNQTSLGRLSLRVFQTVLSADVGRT